MRVFNLLNKQQKIIFFIQLSIFVFLIIKSLFELIETNNPFAFVCIVTVIHLIILTTQIIYFRGEIRRLNQFAIELMRHNLMLADKEIKKSILEYERNNESLGKHK